MDEQCSSMPPTLPGTCSRIDSAERRGFVGPRRVIRRSASADQASVSRRSGQS